MITEKLSADHQLIYESSKISNGQNVHQLKTLLSCYYGYMTLYNIEGKEDHKNKVLELEKRIRILIQEDRNIYYANILKIEK